MDTAIEARGSAVRFVVETADEHTRDLLARMGYLPADDRRSATRWLESSPDIHRYFERFTASIELMLLQQARQVTVPWEPALLEFLRRAEGTDLRWWLYGTGALAVRGLAVEPGDIDIHVDDAALAGRLLDDLLVTPVERLEGWVADYAGRAFCHAVVEWLSESHERDSEQGALIEPHLETVRWRGYEIRVPPLSAQLAACEQRGLTDRAALIQAAMRRTP